MPEKLKDYQVLDVFCGGTFYKVRHKVTNNVFAWRAHNCSAYSDEQIQAIVNEVKITRQLLIDSVLRYYDTILHGPSRTLYFVLEYTCWRSLDDLLSLCKATERCLAEVFIWRLLHELARVAEAVDNVHFVALQKCISTSSIFVSESGDLRVNCFDLNKRSTSVDLMRQIGDVARALCVQSGGKIVECRYSDDLRDVISLLTDDRSVRLRPAVVLYHPSVLANLETVTGPLQLSQMLIAEQFTSCATSNLNKCDSEKAGELSKAMESLPRTHFNQQDSPVYSNITPKRKSRRDKVQMNTIHNSLSPTLAALALELPGFVPRCRKPFTEITNASCPQQVSQETLSQQWMTRLIALREREASLNKRERDLIAKEIVSSPSTKVVSLETSHDFYKGSNGITLPLLLEQVTEERRASRRQRRSSSTRSRGRRKSYAHEDLDSSLSADAGDGSMIITATKFTHENMPRRTIFPDVASKKVHFTSSNPFTESDESVTLTFYELENVDGQGYQVPKAKDYSDISKFKYLDVEKVVSEKRAATQWSHSSPSKQAKVCKGVFSDITNNKVRHAPSKSSLVSKDCNSNTSVRSQWSVDGNSDKSDEFVSNRTRSSMRQSMACTPSAPAESKKSKRRSLLPFKTPFKFMSSAKN